MCGSWVLLTLLLVLGDGRGPGGVAGDLRPSPVRSVEMRVEFEVREEVREGTVVGRIPTKPGFTYRFNEHVEEFRLNGSTGEIRTGKVIDREALATDRFDLVVLSSQPTYPVEVRITVLDENGMLFSSHFAHSQTRKNRET
jgi:hypothetical protein